MHWNNGRFYGPVTLENKLSITDYKYNAIEYFEDENKNIKFGDNTINTIIDGNNININSQNKTIIFSVNDMMINSLHGGTYINSVGKEVVVYTGTVNEGKTNEEKYNNCIFMNKNNDITIKSNGNISINGNEKLLLGGKNSGIGIHPDCYSASVGKTLPTSGNYEGRIFFKLIS